MAKKKSASPDADFPKPKMFVGCASEKGRLIAEKFISALDKTGKVTAVGWWEATDFRPMHSTLEGLLQAVDRFDFGLFILTPDDLTKSRGKSQPTIRDNVLFELGMFLGRLGPKRAFAVLQTAAHASNPVKTPSDLLGIYIPWFKNPQAPEEQNKEVRKALEQIVSVVDEEGFKPPGLRPLKNYDIYRKEKSFGMTVSADIINANLELLKGGHLTVVAYRPSPSVHFLRDTKITVGNIREIVDNERDDPVVFAPLKPLGDIKKNDDIDGYLVFIPRYVNIDDAKTLYEMKRRGCHLIGGGGITATASLKV